MPPVNDILAVYDDFMAFLQGLFNAVPSDWNLIFTGHSLGGALALLAATKAGERSGRVKKASRRG